MDYARDVPTVEVPMGVLRAAKLRLIEAEIESKLAEAKFGQLKIEEVERNMRLERATPGEDNTLTFSSTIDDQVVSQAIRTLDIWSRRTPGCDMTIIFTSSGGEVVSGFKFYDFLHDLKKRGHNLTIKVYGGAFSWGAGLLQAADDRVMSPNSFLIFHEIQMSDIDGNYTEVFVEGKNRVDMFQDKLLSIFAEKSTMSPKQIKNRIRGRDWMLTAEEAVRHGFADRIS